MDYHCVALQKGIATLGDSRLWDLGGPTSALGVVHAAIAPHVFAPPVHHVHLVALATPPRGGVVSEVLQGLLLAPRFIPWLALARLAEADIIGMGGGFAITNLDGCQTTYKPSEKWGGVRQSINDIIYTLLSICVQAGGLR